MDFLFLRDPLPTLTNKKLEYDIVWTTTADDPMHKALNSTQKINHFPGIGDITKKKRLGENLNVLRKQFPHDYDFFPPS